MEKHMVNAIEWTGVERRSPCIECAESRRMEVKMRECKDEIDADISSTNRMVEILSEEVTGLRGDVHGLRGDVHNVAGSVKSMEASLSTIAETMTKLSNLPEAWQNITGFLKVMRWMRENFITVAIVFATVAYVTYMGGKAGGLIP